jgi:hypothetical protein
MTNVKVAIWEPGASEPTDEGTFSGSYLFEVLPGTYFVTFEANEEGFAYTERQAGPADIDSDAGESDEFIVQAGDDLDTIDAGFVRVMAVDADVDSNNNGPIDHTREEVH